MITVKVRQPTYEENLYADIGARLVHENISVLDQALDGTIRTSGFVLSALLVAAALQPAQGIRVAACILSLCALGAAFIGRFPRASRIVPNESMAVKDFVERTSTVKRRTLLAAGTFLAGAIGVAIFSMLNRG